MEKEIVVARKYKILEFIGNGKFGSVFKGEKIDTAGTGTCTGTFKKEVAIKIESKENKIHLLKTETRVLEYLARNGCRKHIPQVFWYGLQENSIFMVMSFLGNISLDSWIFPSLESLLEWFYLAISILEKIHLYGVLHRDLKPGHFLFYQGTWVLIDFGFATFVSPDYSDKNKKEEPVREWIIGTPNYISVSVHEGFDPCEKDDMISLGYIFLEKYRREKLPWSNYQSSGSNSSVEWDKYPTNHILHVANQERKRGKSKDLFFPKIIDIPILLEYMEIYYDK